MLFQSNTTLRLPVDMGLLATDFCTIYTTLRASEMKLRRLGGTLPVLRAISEDYHGEIHQIYGEFLHDAQVIYI